MFYRNTSTNQSIYLVYVDVTVITSDEFEILRDIFLYFQIKDKKALEAKKNRDTLDFAPQPKMELGFRIYGRENIVKLKS